MNIEKNFMGNSMEETKEASQDVVTEIMKYLGKLSDSEYWCVVFFDLCNSVLIKNVLEKNCGNLLSTVHNNAVIKVVSEVTSKVEIWKLLGDGILVGFKSIKDAILSSISFAIEFKRKTAPLKKYLEQNGFMDGLHFRVGMNWGPVYKHIYDNVKMSHLGEIVIGKDGVGNVIDPLGVTVDLAHRVTSSALPDTILITSNCLEMCNEKSIKANGWFDIHSALESPLLKKWVYNGEGFISPIVFFSIKGVKFPVGVHKIEWGLERGILPAQNLSNIGDLVYTLKRSDKNVEDITDTERERLYLSIFSIFIEMEKGGVLLNYLKDAFEKICTDIQLTIAEFSWVKLWSGDIPIESESLKVIRKKLENAKCDLYNSYSIYLNWFENDTKLLHLNENLKKEVYTGNLESWPAIQWVKLIDLIKNKNPMWATMIASIENRLFRDRDEGDKYAVLWLERISFLRVVQAISEKSTIGLNTILKYVKNSLRYAMEANAPEATAIEEFINLLEAGGLMKYEVNDKILNQLKLLGLTKESIENF